MDDVLMGDERRTGGGEARCAVGEAGWLMMVMMVEEEGGKVERERGVIKRVNGGSCKERGRWKRWRWKRRKGGVRKVERGWKRKRKRKLGEVEEERRGR